MKFRKKPLVIDAFIFGYDDPPDWFYEAVQNGTIEYLEEVEFAPKGLRIKTLEGDMTTSYGHEYIVKGIQGEIYPVKPEIFEQSYEAEKGDND